MHVKGVSIDPSGFSAPLLGLQPFDRSLKSEGSILAPFSYRKLLDFAWLHYMLEGVGGRVREMPYR